MRKLRIWLQFDTEQVQAQEPTGRGQKVEAEGTLPKDAAIAASPVEASSDDGLASHERYRSRLSAQYELDSEYIGAGELARILGLSPSAIYRHMRSGRLLLLYPMFNAAPKILIDDLVE